MKIQGQARLGHRLPLQDVAPILQGAPEVDQKVVHPIDHQPFRHDAFGSLGIMLRIQQLELAPDFVEPGRSGRRPDHFPVDPASRSGSRG